MMSETDRFSQMNPNTNHPNERTAELVEREPGDVVLRAERIHDKPFAELGGTLEYNCPSSHSNEPAPDRPNTRFPYGVNWPLAILAVLASFMALVALVAVLSIKPIGVSVHAKSTAAKADIGQLLTAIQQFQQDTGRLPSRTAGLNDLLTQPPRTNGWKGPYVKSIPTDPWGTPYQYVAAGSHNIGWYDLSSAGPDRKFGTSDDIVNW